MRVLLRDDFTEFLAKCNLNQRELAKKISMNHVNLNKCVKGNLGLSPNVRRKIMKALGVRNTEWFKIFKIEDKVNDC